MHSLVHAFLTHPPQKQNGKKRLRGTEGEMMWREGFGPAAADE